MRGLDHIVPAFHNLETAREHYKRLGFNCTPRGLHEWGTDNSIIQLNGFFIELLEVGRPELLFDHDGNQFSFGAFNRDFLKKREGASMLVLESTDSAKDREVFSKAKNLHLYDLFGFERTAVQPDGAKAKVGFTLNFVKDHNAPGIGYFTCEQHAPQYFWKENYQQHENTAVTIEEILIVSRDPAEHAAFFEEFSGVSAEWSNSNENIYFKTPRGLVTFSTANSAIESWGETSLPQDVNEPHIAAMLVGVNERDELEHRLLRSRIDYIEVNQTLIVEAEDNFGLAVGFRQL